MTEAVAGVRRGHSPAKWAPAWAQIKFHLPLARPPPPAQPRPAAGLEGAPQMSYERPPSPAMTKIKVMRTTPDEPAAGAQQLVTGCQSGWQRLVGLSLAIGVSNLGNCLAPTALVDISLSLCAGGAGAGSDWLRPILSAARRLAPIDCCRVVFVAFSRRAGAPPDPGLNRRLWRPAGSQPTGCASANQRRPTN